MPGLIAVIMMVIAALLTSLTVAREWERGTMEQLISTPVSGPELILGKLSPYFVIGMLDVLTGGADGRVPLPRPLRGSVSAPARRVCAFFCVGALSMGILISDVAKTQSAGQPGRHGDHVPAGVSAVGLIYAIRNMPHPIQVGDATWCRRATSSRC